ncbi:hypothetical protein C0Q70_13316 [Pomacea canaliculata]|uniref:Uncharacterized protein n=1 Tax=Pomacea canaliculata TaxID=400727 RepID=A0A2T7NWX5_POMCA|nr:hypothetical protein C0Q70_13316 [Pomacea canaliculata]
MKIIGNTAAVNVGKLVILLIMETVGKGCTLNVTCKRIIEMFVPGTTDDKELYDTLAFSAIFVKKLDIRQLLPPAEIAHKDSMLNTDESLEKRKRKRKILTVMEVIT